MEYQKIQENRYSELRISDYSSDEENVYSQNNDKVSTSGEAASVYISWSTDDEMGTDNCQGLPNRSFMNQKSVTPVSCKCTNSARKSKLPNVCVKRKMNKLIETPSQIRPTLPTRNVPLKDKSNDNRSPWCKVRKTFAALRYQRSLPTIDTLAANKENTLTKNRSLSQKSDGTSIEWSSSSSESGSPTRPTCNGTSTTQMSTAPTELELLVALIERENAASKVPNHTTKNKQKRKRFIQGGYAERLQKLEEANRIERNFLHHDQQLGLQNGTRMRVLELNQAYGVHIAKVELDQSNNTTFIDNDSSTKSVRIIIDADMAAHVRVGSKIEAFFDMNTKPYSIIDSSDIACKEIIYVQPHKLLLW